MTAQNELTASELMEKLAKYLRMVNYLGAAQLYLRENFLLEKPLQQEHLKKRILGHWGTVPGLNFIYATLNLLIKRHNQEVMLVVGPGHGYPALLANLYVEGTLGKYYPDYQYSREAFGGVIKNFSWPGGFPSHANPETPGVILEGGELGYSLATAFGAAFDNPDMLVACIVGDGEAETAATAAAWHSTKFLDPVTDGAVLPIVHINKYKISGPTIYGTMSNEELYQLFSGMGYEPMFVEGEFLYEPMIQTLENAYGKIKQIQNEAREKHAQGEEFSVKPRFPVIIFKSKKGWTGPKMLKGQMVEDSFRSHGIPLEKVHEDPEEFQLLKDWLESYRVQELLTPEGKPVQDILDLVPEPELCMGRNKSANGERTVKLTLPDLADHALKLKSKGEINPSNMARLGDYLKEVITKNPATFRLMSPDETESNRLHMLFDVTKRAYTWPVPEGSENIGPGGRVMEILSEHTLEGWMHGYVLTGRQSVFISYEAFIMIVASMVDQYTKFLKQSKKISWRRSVPSLNFVLTSTAWRQDHNGYSHQNPGFISSALNDYSNVVRIHFPVDANMLLATMEEFFNSSNGVNVIVAGKTPLPQYLSLDEARNQMRTGLQTWSWAGNLDNDSNSPDVVFAATGDYATFETLAAMQLLKEQAPQMRTRFVSVSELTCFGIGDNSNQSHINYQDFNNIFTADRNIVYAYHGYPDDIKHLIFNHPAASRFDIHGYQEKGTTTTPLDILVVNNSSRYQLALSALEYAGRFNHQLKKQLQQLSSYFKTLLEKHQIYIKETGEDLEEVRNFKLKF